MEGTDEMKAVAFTGYRLEKMPFAEEQGEELYVRFRRQQYRVITRLIERGYSQFISGMATGFDTWVAEDILELKKAYHHIRLECAIPYPDQDKGWDLFDKERRKKIILHADSSIFVCNHYSNDCFFERNRYMVDRADVVVCAYDGKAGGTAYTVHYALRQNKIVIQINPTTAQVTIISHRNFDCRK